MPLGQFHQGERKFRSEVLLWYKRSVCDAELERCTRRRSLLLTTRTPRSSLVSFLECAGYSAKFRLEPLS